MARENQEVQSELGRRLRAARLARGLTMRELADESGVTIQTVARMETRPNEPRLLEVLRSMARALRAELSDLIA